MIPRTIRETATALLVSILFFGTLAEAQAPATSQQPQAATVRPDPKRAKKAAELGDKAEAAGRNDEALADYEEAAKYAPQDQAIVERFAGLRSKLVRDYVEAAERDALAGHMDQATEDLGAAMRIDPGNAIVLERMAQMKRMAADADTKMYTQQIEGLPKLQPQSGKHTVDLRGDTKTVYEQLALMFGVKAAFDPDLTARPVRLRLGDVDFYTALAVMGRETGTFWLALDPTLFFVAQDTTEKRKQYEPVVEQTFYLSSAAAAEDMTEMVRVIRDITGITHIVLDSTSHTITLRDTPDKLALVNEIISTVDRARGEVMLEFELLEVDRNKAQQLGIQFPTSARLITIPPQILTQLRQAKNLSALTTLLTSIFGSSVTSLSSVPPFMVVGGGLSTFLLTLPSTGANFSDALTLVQSGRQVLLRAQDGKPATFFVGDRYPITLSLLSGSLGGGGFTPSIGGSTNLFPSTTYPAGKGPVAIVAADIRNIGEIDLAAVNELDNTVSILLNDGGGAGTFTAATGSPISLGTARAIAPAIAPQIASAVFTSSGFHDLLITDPDTNAVLLLTAAKAGDGTFNAPISIPVGNGPSSVVTGDFNGDGNQDFIVTNFSDNTFSVFLGKGDGTFTQLAGSPFALQTNVQDPIAMAVADFNGDGKLDLAIVNQKTIQTPPITQGNVVVFEGNGDGTFTPFSTNPIVVGQLPVAIATGDLDTNGSADLAVVNQTDTSVTVLLNGGSGLFTLAGNSPLSTAQTPTGIAIADFNEDGHQDIAVTNAGANTFSILVGLGGGLFELAFQPPAGTNPTALVAATLAGGSFPDLAITNDLSGEAGDVNVILSPASSISNGSGGIPQQAYPASEYVDLGVKIKATPTLHPNNEVTLQLEFEIRALSGLSVNGIPVISNRTLTQTVRVREDQPTLLGGLTDREETKSITGLPGFANLSNPLAYAFGTKNSTSADSELMILITPRRLRFPSRTSRAIGAGRGDRTPTIVAPTSPSERQNQ